MRCATAVGTFLAATQAIGALTQVWVDRFDAKPTRVPESVSQVVTFPSGDIAIVVQRRLYGRTADSVERFSPIGVRRWFRESIANTPWNVREIRAAGEELLVGFETNGMAGVELLNSEGNTVQSIPLDFRGRPPYMYGAMGLASDRALVGMGFQANRTTGSNEVVVVRRSSRSFTAHTMPYPYPRETARMVMTPTFAAYIGIESMRIDHRAADWKGLSRLVNPERVTVLPSGEAVVAGVHLSKFRVTRIPVDATSSPRFLERGVDARGSLDAVSHNPTTNQTFFAGSLQGKPNLFTVDWNSEEIDNSYRVDFAGQSSVSAVLPQINRQQPDLVLGNVDRGTGWQPYILPPDGRSLPRFLPRGPSLRAAANRVGKSGEAWLAGESGNLGWLNAVRLVDVTPVLRVSTSREVGTDEHPEFVFPTAGTVPSVVVVGTTTGPDGPRPYLTRTTASGERAVTLDFGAFPSFGRLRSATKVSEDLVAMLIDDRNGEDVLVHVDVRSGRIGPGLPLPGQLPGVARTSFRSISADADRNVVLLGSLGSGAAVLASLDRSQRLRWTVRIEDARWPTLEILGMTRGTLGNLLLVARGIERGGTARLLFVSVNRLDGRQIAIGTAPWPTGYMPGTAILRPGMDNRFVLALERIPTQPSGPPDVQLVSGFVGASSLSSIVVPREGATEATLIAMEPSSRGDELVLVAREVSGTPSLRIFRYTAALRSLWRSGPVGLSGQSVAAAVIADRELTRIVFREYRAGSGWYLELDRSGQLRSRQWIESAPLPAMPRLHLLAAFEGMVLVSNPAATRLDAASTVQLLR